MADVSVTSKGVTEGADYEALFYTNTGVFGSGVAGQGVVMVRRDGTTEPARTLALEVTSSGLSTASTYTSGDQVGAVLEFTGAPAVGRIVGVALNHDADSNLSGDALTLLLYRDDPSGSAPGDNAAISLPFPAPTLYTAGILCSTGGQVGGMTAAATLPPLYGFVTDDGSLFAIVRCNVSSFDFATSTGLSIILFVEPA